MFHTLYKICNFGGYRCPIPQAKINVEQEFGICRFRESKKFTVVAFFLYAEGQVVEILFFFLGNLPKGSP